MSTWFAFLFSTLIVGKMPFAPGTWGSLLAVCVWWLLNPLSFYYQLLLILFAFLCGWWATALYETHNKKHDPKEVVVDELIGMWLTLFAAPRILWVYALGFLFFRIFDIWKPFPIGWVDRKVPGAFGTLLDDVIAGVFAGFVLFGVQWVWI